jgi:hypothetical protein
MKVFLVWLMIDSTISGENKMKVIFFLAQAPLPEGRRPLRGPEGRRAGKFVQFCKLPVIGNNARESKNEKASRESKMKMFLLFVDVHSIFEENQIKIK